MFRIDRESFIHKMLTEASEDRLVEQYLLILKDYDHPTYSHSKNVGLLTTLMLYESGLPYETVKEIIKGALLHDIGKIRVPKEILAKPGPLTEQEISIVKTHVGRYTVTLNGFSDIVQSIVHLHHETLDGKGYPNQMPGTIIPYYVNMVAVANTYSSLTEDRCYRSSYSSRAAFNMLYTSTDKYSLTYIRTLEKALNLARQEIGAASNVNYPAIPVVQYTNAY